MAHDPLNPSEEDRLFETLSMSQEEYEILQFIRRHMKYITRAENEKRHDTGRRSAGDSSSPKNDQEGDS